MSFPAILRGMCGACIGRRGLARVLLLAALIFSFDAAALPCCLPGSSFDGRVATLSSLAQPTHPALSAQDSSGSSFGQITVSSVNPRLIQFVAKFLF